MARRGRCRCGTVLRFDRGPQGYKTTCPSCKSVVRLSLGKTERQRVVCPCGARVRVRPGGSQACPKCHRLVLLPEPGEPVQQALERALAPTQRLDAFETSHTSEPLPVAEALDEDDDDEVVSVAAAALPSAYGGEEAAAEPAAPEPTICRACGSTIPPDRRRCPTCEARNHGLAALADNVFLEPCSDELVAVRPREAPSAWLVGVAVVVAVCVVVLLWSVWRLSRGTL